MKKVIPFMLAALLALLGQSIAFGDSPSAPTTTLKSTFPVTSAPQQFQVVQQVLDFPQGAWTPAHSHGGQAFVMIAKGVVTQFSDGKLTTYKVGDTWTETPGHVHQAGNTTSSPARTLVTFLLPPGAQQTTPHDLADARPSTVKTTAVKSQFDVQAVARPFDVIEMQLDYAPGQVLPSHTYGGPAFVTVLDGQLTARVGGADKIYKAGESWSETAGQFSEVRNEASAPASAFVTVLLPKGMTLTTLENQPKGQPATLPETGGVPETPTRALVLISVLLIFAGAILWQRNATRAR